MTGEGIRWESTAVRGLECTDMSLCGTDCKRVQRRRYGRFSGRNSLSKSEKSSKRALSDISGRWIRIEREACSVRKDSIVDVSVLYDGSRVVPFAIDNEPDAQQGRCDEGGFERRDGGGHGIASDTITHGEYFE